MAASSEKEETFLSSISSCGSEEEITFFCLPCDTDGFRYPAYGYCTNCREHLCESCFKHHKRHTLSRHHTLLDKDSMPQTQFLISTRSASSDFLTKPCKTHKKEIIKFYCPTHMALLCSVCVTLEHSTSTCDIRYIPDISDQVINSKNYTDILKTLNTVSEEYQDMLDSVKRMTTKSNDSLSDVLADIKEFRNEINQKLDDLEKHIEAAVKSIKQDNTMKMKTIQATCEHVSKSLKTTSDSIKNLNTSKQPDKLFVELKEAEQMIKTTNFTKDLVMPNIKEYHFKPNAAITCLLKKENTLGTLLQKTLKRVRHPSTAALRFSKALYQGEICVKTSHDKTVCCVTGMTVLNPAFLIIADHDNSSVKIVDTRSNAVVDQVQLDASPWDITSVTSNKLAVTLPNTQTIQFLSALSNKLRKENSLTVDGHCQGISCYKGRIAVTFCNPAKVQVMDVSGNVLTTVAGRNIFRYPEYVATSNRGIYTSDWELKTVSHLNWTGDVVGGYGGLDEPSGIAVTEEGNVLVADNCKNMIEEISVDCSHQKTVLKDKNCARAISWCTEQNILYFSSESGDKSNYLQVYKLT